MEGLNRGSGFVSFEGIDVLITLFMGGKMDTCSIP